MCCSIATRNCNHNLFELISIHQLLNCNKRLQYVATQPAISAKSQKTRVYTVMLCIWVKNQPYMQTRSAWHVVEVVHPGWVRAPDLRPGVWPACGAQGCGSLRATSRPGLHGTWWKLYVLAAFELQISCQVCGLLVVPRDVSHSDRAVVVSPCVTDLCVVWVCAAWHAFCEQHLEEVHDSSPAATLGCVPAEHLQEQQQPSRPVHRRQTDIDAVCVHQLLSRALGQGRARQSLRRIIQQAG
jgi:hypothetical protein